MLYNPPVMHRALRSRVEQGLELPTNEAEYRALVATDPRAVRRKDAKRALGRVRGTRAMLKKQSRR